MRWNSSLFHSASVTQSRTDAGKPDWTRSALSALKEREREKEGAFASFKAFRHFRSHSHSYTRSPQQEYETCMELWEWQSHLAPCWTSWRATRRSRLTWWCSCAAWVSSSSPLPALRRLFALWWACRLASDFLLSLCEMSLGKGERLCLPVIMSQKSMMAFTAKHVAVLF